MGVRDQGCRHPVEHRAKSERCYAAARRAGREDAADDPRPGAGVVGKGRTYDQAFALLAVTSTEGMTADYYPFPHEFLGRMATRPHPRGAGDWEA